MSSNPFYKRFLVRPLSYSQLSAWEYNKEEWYERYVLNKRGATNAAMKAGSIIGDSIGTPNSLIPELNPPGVKEYELRASLGDIHMVGYCDHYDPETKVLHENKTSTNRKKWNQKSVDTHKQLDMYALMLFLTHDVLPEEIQMYLNYVRVIEGQDMHYYLPDPVEFVQYPTKRTAQHLVDMAKYIEKTVAEMCGYAQNYSTASPAPIHMDTLSSSPMVI